MIIKNGTIIDGTGKKAYKADLLIKNGKIEGIGDFSKLTDDEIIDAEGKCVTPGFIDAHRHHDLALLFDDNFGEIELAQGITTAIAGNCGLSPAPSNSEIFGYIEPCLGKAPEGIVFNSVKDYIDAVKAKALPINIGVLAATGTISAYTKGYGKTEFTSSQIDQACSLIDEAFEAGALGLSCGIMYDPECLTLEEDFVKMAKVAAKHGKYLTSHIRGEGNSLTKSVQEVIRISEKAGLPLNISHFKVTGIKNWGHGLDSAIELIEKNGTVTVDAYPYTAGSTTIMSLLPPTVKDIHDFSFLEKEINREHSDWDNMVSSIGWDKIVISSAICEEDRRFTGLDFASAALKAGIPAHELMAGLIERNDGKVGVILNSMAEEDVKRVLSLPYCSLISDSLYGGGDMPHPRLYGSFPRLIRKYVNEEKLFTLEEAVKKMTLMPAKRLGLSDRGEIKEGFTADLLVFDPSEIKDNASFENPKQLSTGIDKILISGKIVMSEGKILKRNTGMFVS